MSDFAFGCSVNSTPTTTLATRVYFKFVVASIVAVIAGAVSKG